MSLPSENFNAEIFLSDLHFQCKLFERSIQRLEFASEHWIKLSKGINDKSTFSPLEIIAECTVCLSAMSAIRRILKPRSHLSPESKNRGTVLYNFLNKPDITNLSSPSVRNSWEHHDKRLDKLLSSREIGNTSLCELYISPKPPKEGTIVVRRFDPVNLSIHFSNEMIPLKPCIQEIQLLKKEIESSYGRLAEGVVEV